MTHDLNTKAGRRAAYKDLFWGDHGFLRAFFSNLHHIGGDMYRANQPSPRRLKQWKKMGIKTILNLRGESPKGYYLLEKEACEELGMTLVDYRMYSRDVHTPEKIFGARDLFEKIEYPCVMHCKSGCDRTGIMAVLYRHFHMGDDIEVAAEQLSLKYLHVKHAKTGMLDHFFQTYLDQGKKTGVSFSDWVVGSYDPQAVKSAFKPTWLGRAAIDWVLRRE